MLTKAEIWIVGRTVHGIAVFLRVPTSSQCLPIYVEPHEAREILCAQSGTMEKPQNYKEFFIAFTEAVSVIPEAMEIRKSDVLGQYRTLVHFSGNDIQFSLESQTPLALALMARCNKPIFIEDSILEEDGGVIMISDTDELISAQLTQLQGELNKRVYEEDYEQAANIRDRIRQIEKQMRLNKG